MRFWVNKEAAPKHLEEPLALGWALFVKARPVKLWLRRQKRAQETD